MPATVTDRLLGLTTSVAVKPPCVAVSNSNVTLAGLQAIGAVTVVQDDRVLVIGQTDQTENGIYIADSGDWNRAKDFDGARDAVQGTLVLVRNQFVEGAFYEVTTANPIRFGTSLITFRLRDNPNVTYDLTQAEIDAGITPTDYSWVERHVNRYDADPTGVANSSAAITSAWSVALQYTRGAEVTLGRGDYSVTTLNFQTSVSDFKPGMRLVGEGRGVTRIVARQAGEALITLEGCNWVTVEKLTFDSTAFASQCAIFLARNTTSPSCAYNKFVDMEVTGSYTKAGVVSLAAESTVWDRCHFENTNAAALYRTFYTSTRNNEIAVIPTTPSSTVEGPNTDNQMFGCQFYSPFTDSRIVQFSRAASYKFSGCTIIGYNNGGAARNCFGAVYSDPITNVFGGPIEWHGCHFEIIGGSSAAHYLDGGNSQNTFTGISSIGGDYVIGQGCAILDYARRTAGAQPILQGAFWTKGAIPNNDDTSHMYLYGAYSCAIDLSTDNGKNSLFLTGLAVNADLRATTVVCPSLTGCNTETFGTASPVTGTYGTGHVHYRNPPVAGAPVSWISTVAGTMGTLNGGATTATTTNGSNQFTVSSATGLAVGQLLTIAGAGDYTVGDISGTTVWSTANIVASVAGAAVSFRNGTFVTSAPAAYLEGSATYDPPNLADGAGATTTLTITGAALGDYADGVSFSLDLQGITLTPYISAANTMAARFQNETGGALDLASGTLRGRSSAR